jgi:transcriptional regulator with XRE-family HTH domain
LSEVEVYAASSRGGSRETRPLRFTLLAARIARDATLTALAERTCIPVQRINMIESGEELLAPAELIEICCVLDLKLSGLFRWRIDNTLLA